MGKLLLALALAIAAPVQGDIEGLLRQTRRLEQAGDTAGAAEACRVFLQQAPQGSTERARALLALATLEGDLGRYADSARHAHEAATIFKARGDERPLSNALNRAGLAFLYAGDYRQAGESFRSAVAVSTRAGDHEGRAEQLTNAGNVHYFVGRYVDAARTYDQALAVTTASGPAPWTPRRRRLVLANQAILYQRLGRDEQALALYQELGATGGDLPAQEQAQLLVNLGVLYRRLGDPVKALTTYDRARALFARDRHVDGELGVIKNRGIVLALDLGRLDEAERSFSEALDKAVAAGNGRETLHARVYRGETRLRAGRAAPAREDFTRALALARELRTPEEEWKALYGLGRVETDAAASSEFLRKAVMTIEGVRERILVPSLRSDFLNDKREVYDALIAASLDGARPEQVFDLVERSHSRVWRERLGLAGSIELTAVQKALPEGVLLLDYWSGSRAAAVVVLSRARAAVVPVHVEPDDIRAFIDTLAAGPSQQWRTMADRLGSRLLPPGTWFEGVRHVIVVPDAALALVPFELLPSGKRLLVERAAVTYTPTAATLLRDAPRWPRWRPPWELQLEAFADPVFRSAALDDVERVRGRLTSSGSEVTQIADEMPGRRLLYVGEQNLKTHLLRAPARAPVLHIATHAAADENAMERSRIIFSPEPGSGSTADYLFLKEAYGLPLDGVELAVLSACDTERGRLVRSEGVQSFSRAFLASGARSTVTTLWQVADKPTADFMRIFYHHLQLGLPRDEALRQAKLRFLESTSELSNPHFWAAFVLTGDGLRPVPRAARWASTVTASLAALAFPTLAIWMWRRRRRFSRRPQPV